MLVSLLKESEPPISSHNLYQNSRASTPWKGAEEDRTFCALHTGLRLRVYSTVSIESDQRMSVLICSLVPGQNIMEEMSQVIKSVFLGISTRSHFREACKSSRSSCCVEESDEKEKSHNRIETKFFFAIFASSRTFFLNFLFDIFVNANCLIEIGTENILDAVDQLWREGFEIRIQRIL